MVNAYNSRIRSQFKTYDSHNLTISTFITLEWSMNTIWVIVRKWRNIDTCKHRVTAMLSWVKFCTIRIAQTDHY